MLELKFSAGSKDSSGTVTQCLVFSPFVQLPWFLLFTWEEQTPQPSSGLAALDPPIHLSAVSIQQKPLGRCKWGWGTFSCWYQCAVLSAPSPPSTDNQRILHFGKEICDHQVQLMPKPPLTHVPRCQSHMAFKSFPLMSAFDNILDEEIFPISDLNLPWHNLRLFLLLLSLATCEKRPTQIIRASLTWI